MAYCTALIIQSLEMPNFVQWVLAEVAIIEGKGIIAWKCVQLIMEDTLLLFYLV